MNIKSPTAPLLTELRALWQLVFSDSDEFLDRFFSIAFSPERCRCITMDERPIAVLYWSDCVYNGRKIAYIYAVATHPNHRSMGYASTLIEDTHRHLKSLGYAGAILVPVDRQLFGFYERLGYTPCSLVDEISAKASTTPTKIRMLTTGEYAEKRRALLPPDGVIEEDELLNLLSTEANFFGGEDFVLAAETDGKKFRGVELLGNKERIPDILCALGYAAGVFRTPGTERHFAMYATLSDESSVAPSYFGLALD